MRLARLLVALCLAFCAAAAAHAETAGQVMFAYGETLAMRAGRIVRLNAGAPVESGDQLHTGVDSYLQIRFTDWGLISLRPRTDFVIDEYAYEARQGGRERAFFSLLSGGLRSLTGLIGHRDRRHYRVRTNSSAIGIRGTHYSVLICKQDCKFADGSLGADGLYGGVIDGRIAVSPYGGSALEREFGAGEYFRLENENSIPARLFVPPSFFWDKLDPQARSSTRNFAGTPWQPAPGASPGPSGRLAPIAGVDLPDTAGSLLRTDGSLVLSPITSPVLSQVGLLVNPVVAPVAPALGTTVGLVASPVVASVAPVVAPVVIPVLAPIAPVVTPITAAVPQVSPVIAPSAPAVSLPTAPSLPVVGGLPSLLPKK